MNNYDDDDNFDGDGDDNQIGAATRMVRFQNASQPWQQPPWHLWGNAQEISAQGAVVGSPLNKPGSTQLLKISYGRPETWHWVFTSTLLEGPNAPILSTVVEIFFDLNIGIGRNVIVIPNFEVHRFDWAVPSLAPVGTKLWTTTTKGNRLFSAPAAPPIVTEPTDISQVVAQDIQVSARMQITTAGGLATARVGVEAQFSPKTHVRPDWFLAGPPTAKYAGSETGGR